ncbi:hypothetical protein BJY04DRAFT_203982 [Aspergillus karnatakaensis]|uniref:uncharacterized protein n=1 Tax=Aspergillus karnatakaensis TaxID=1810916 RepID=UPI003CCD6F2C
MITPQDITIVICHGSYHTPIAYTPFINALKSQGYEVHCPQRPTCDLSRLNVGDTANPDFTNDPPPGGYPTDTDDVATTQALLDQLIKKENKQVLLAARSSGGYIATQAATPAYQAQARKRAGESGGIIGIFYFGAFLIPVGESVHTFFNKDVKPDDPLPPFFKFYV